MTSPEYQPRNAMDFFEATRQLPDGDGFLLSRNRIQLIHKGRVELEKPVHYEGLNYLSDIHRPIDPDRIVTDEFKVRIIDSVLREQGETPQTTYPLMTVINQATGAHVSETVNVAKLIKEHSLPVYARDTIQGDEVLSLGISTLAKIIARRAGVNPVGAVIVENNKVHDVEDVIPRIWRRSDSFEDHDSIDNGLNFNPRGAESLSLLQMDIAQDFIESPNRVTQGVDGRVEVAYHMTGQPDMQTLLLGLIDLVESRHMHLFFTHIHLSNGEEESVFKVVGNHLEELFILSSAQTLDIAVYNARLKASNIFNEV